MTASNTFGRATVWALTNKSGGGVVAGDVVIVDTSNNDSFTTTTSGSSTALIGIATGTIASNAIGLVLISGYASLVNVNASVTRGHYGVTHTVAKQATDGGASRTTGTFCQFLTGGTTPDALIFTPDLGGAALTNPMTTKGDIIQGDTGGTPVRLGAGSSGQVLTSGGAAAFNSWAAATAPPIGVLSYAPGSDSAIITTNSTSMVDVDATNVKVTFTAPASGIVIVECEGFAASDAGNYMKWGLREASSDIAGPYLVVNASAGGGRQRATFRLTGISAGSHTYKLSVGMSSAANGSVLGGPNYGPVTMLAYAG